MPNILTIESATEACSAALSVDGRIMERSEIAPRRHAELILPMIESLLAEAGLARTQLDGIAVGCGPGAFTGVRLAIAVAQGLALALDIPIVPVSSLAALAQDAPDAGAARMGWSKPSARNASARRTSLVCRKVHNGASSARAGMRIAMHSPRVFPRRPRLPMARVSR